MNAIDAIPTFKAGNHRGQPYTVDDLDDMVRNFAACSSGGDPPLRVPLVIGHDESQELLARSDLPAAGWVVAVRRFGDELYVDAEDVADLPAELIRGRRYRKVSAEVYDSPPPGLEGLCRGKVLRRVALLGGDIPEVKGLGDIPLPRRMSEGAAALDAVPGRSLVCGHAVALPGGCWAVFSEVRMTGADRQMLIDRLARHGWDTSLVTDAVSDAQLGEMLRVLDSKDQAADLDRDGEADSTQYEAVPPVESVKDGQPLPDGGFAERDLDMTPDEERNYPHYAPGEMEDAERLRDGPRQYYVGSKEHLDFVSRLQDTQQRYRHLGRKGYRLGDDLHREGPYHGAGDMAEGGAARPDPEVVAALLDAGFGRREAEAMAAEAAAAMASFRGHAEDEGSGHYLPGDREDADAVYHAWERAWRGGDKARRNYRAVYGDALDRQRRLGRDGSRLNDDAFVADRGEDFVGDMAEGDSFDSPKARRAVRDLEQRMDAAATDDPAARGDYYRAERALIRTEGDIQRGIDRPNHPGLTGHAEGGTDYGREERIRQRRRSLAGGGRREQGDYFGETRVRRHSESGGGGAMAQGSNPGLVDAFDRAVRQAVGEMRATMLAEFTKIADGVKAEAARAKEDVQKFSEQQERARRVADVDAFLHEMTMGDAPRLTPRARDEQRAVGLSLDDAAVVRKFSEDGKDVELTAYRAWKRGIEALPVIERFAELAGTDGRGGQDALTKEEREVHRAFSENVGGARAFASAEAAVESFRLQKQACPTVTPDEFLGK